MAKTKDKERTEFGGRLLLARKRVGMSQSDLGHQVGLTQTAIAEAESSGQGTTKTVQIAEALGVRAQWLADGTGPMLPTDQEPPPAARTVASEKVAHYLVGSPAATDYRTIALTLASALEESGTEMPFQQFIKLLEATYTKLKP
jgi:transcriptional regulator with XRE-family HTH domain